MTRWNVVTLCGLWTIAAAIGCRERDAADSDRRAGTRDAGERASRVPGDLPLLCASCMQSMPGGDTSDFGSSPPTACQPHERPEVRVIPLAEAEAASGQDFAEQLAAAEGHYELAVRWTDPERSAPTMLEVEVRSTGHAYLTSWVEWTSSATTSLPPCASFPDTALPEVEVQIATADHAVAGSFTGALIGPFTVAPPLWKWSVAGDGASLQGELEFPADPEPHQLLARIDVLDYVDPASDDRGELAVNLVRGASGRVDGINRSLIRGYEARPLDGCSYDTEPHEFVPPRPCDPWTEQRGCCEPVAGTPVLWVLPDGGLGAAPDAGASP